jgi:predicted phosphodiesterase
MYFVYIILFIAFNVAANDRDEYHWIEYIRDNKISARAITVSAICPKIKVNGKYHDMMLRSEIEDIELKQKVKVCEYDVTLANNVAINEKNLKLPAKKINSFIVIGDTGCESSVFDENHRAQNCLDQDAWPFHKVAQSVAKENPDMVIHLGDYAYKNKYNNNEDQKKNELMQWFFFKNEFFQPAKTLLETVPMIFIRGNHEVCSLMGKGWFAFLDPGKFQECVDHTPTYKLNLDDLNFLVFDSSGSKNITGETYKQEFINIEKSLDKPHWMLIHHPVIMMPKLSDAKFFEKVHSPEISKAFSSDITKQISLVISGHYHVAAYLERKVDKLKQLVLGNGGTKIHSSEYKYFPYNDEVSKGEVSVSYGYTKFDRIRNTNNWRATAYSISGEELFHVIYK